MVKYLDSPPAPARLSGPVVRGRVLVFAPHPDDETIGPGGTLLQHSQGGDEIHVVFVTDGTSGDPSGQEDPQAYAEVRVREGRAAAEILGIGGIESWGLPDNHKVTEDDLSLFVPRMIETIQKVKPDVIYAPHEGDQHRDHYATCIALRRALAGLRRPPMAFGYEVYSASLASHVVDISDQYERKMEALKCYGSQLEHTDIERFVTGLNAYRAVFLQKGARFGEAFVPLIRAKDAGRR
ncbi:MAG: PIG-L family deacetylase [Planctomycetota bacterium]